MTLLLTILALGVLASLSPSTLVVFILLLATVRARVNAIAFLVGWGISLGVVFSLSYAAGGAHVLRRSGGRTALEALEVAFGMALVVVAVHQWRVRHRPRPPSGLTRGMAVRLKDLEPWEAVLVGAFAQPWALTAAAAIVVVRQHTALLVALAAFVLFTVASTATVGLTFAYYSREPGEADARLEALRQRLVAAGPAVGAAVSLGVGLYLVVNGALRLAAG
jgi:hypothetical protein